MASPNVILLRARQRTDRNQALASEFARASGCEVLFLLDERTGERDGGTDVLSLNRQSYADLGLYTGPDVAWRCGDYGLYMAWREKPDRSFYWLIEDDVRIAGDPADFFRICQASNADLLCGYLYEARPGHFWWPHTQSRDARPMGCLFPVVRLSPRALQACYAKRQKHSRQWFRRALWPNDEGLVVTTVVNAGLQVSDFNELAPGLWKRETYFVTGGPHTHIPSSGPPHLIHPVRYEERTAAHLKQTGWEDASSLRYRLKQRAVRAYAATRSW